VLELAKRVGRDVRLVERLAHVIGAKIGDFHGMIDCSVAPDRRARIGLILPLPEPRP
jgi:hypothetical protein